MVRSVCHKPCMSCEEELPVACIFDDDRPAPESLRDGYKQYWSGAEIKFTKPVAGDYFATEDDVDAYCAGHFGENWRHLNIKDGHAQGTLIANGKALENYSEYWVGVKDQPHFNCWDLRPDYEDIARQEAVK